MSKKRKTKKEKMVAATRRDFSSALTLPTIQEITSSVLESSTPPKEHAPRISHDYSYVALDVKKTLIITTVLIALNIILFFILRIKILNVPGISF